MTVQGSLDKVTSEYATGWIYQQETRGKLAVQAMLNREIIGEAWADEYRSDMAEVGYGDGKCGYTIQFHRTVEPAFLPFIVVRQEGSDAELPRWSPTGFTEFFNSVYRAFPTAGRTRSVFGGLWTDRLDAAAMLKGRVAIGQIDEVCSAAISDFVRHGVVVVPTTKLADLANATDEAIGEVFTPAVLQVVQAVLDDQPVVLDAEVLRARLGLRQASTEKRLPSPAECLLLIAPVGNELVVLHLIRDSHMLPEFNADGISRWVDAGALRSGEAGLDGQGLVDRVEIRQGQVAFVAAGVLHAVNMHMEGAAIRLLVIPARNAPVSLLQDAGLAERLLASGVRVWCNQIS